MQAGADRPVDRHPPQFVDDHLWPAHRRPVHPLAVVVHRPVHLPAPRVGRHGHSARGVSTDTVQRTHAISRQAEGIGEGLGCHHADPQAGERPWADANHHGVEVTRACRRFVKNLPDQRHQQFRVLSRIDDPPLRPSRHALNRHALYRHAPGRRDPSRGGHARRSGGGLTPVDVHQGDRAGGCRRVNSEKQHV